MRSAVERGTSRLKCQFHALPQGNESLSAFHHWCIQEVDGVTCVQQEEPVLPSCGGVGGTGCGERTEHLVTCNRSSSPRVLPASSAVLLMIKGVMGTCCTQ